MSSFTAPTVGALGEARVAGNGHPLGKRHKDVRGRVNKLTRRASLWCPTEASLKAPTFGAVLDKEMAKAGPASEASALGLAFALRLAAKYHRDAESVIITLTEY